MASQRRALVCAKHGVVVSLLLGNRDSCAIGSPLHVLAEKYGDTCKTLRIWLPQESGSRGVLRGSRTSQTQFTHLRPPPIFRTLQKQVLHACGRKQDKMRARCCPPAHCRSSITKRAGLAMRATQNAIDMQGNRDTNCTHPLRISAAI